MEIGLLLFLVVVGCVAYAALSAWDAPESVLSDPECDALLDEIAALRTAAEAAEKFALTLHREHTQLIGSPANLKHAVTLINAARSGWQSRHSFERSHLLLQGEVLSAANERDSRWIDAFLTAQARTELREGQPKKDPAVELQAELQSMIDERRADGHETGTFEELLRALTHFSSLRRGKS